MDYYYNRIVFSKNLAELGKEDTQQISRCIG